MSSRKIVATVVGLLGCLAVGYAINGLLATGSCGGAGLPGCSDDVGFLVLPLAGGIAASVVATIAGGGVVVFAGLFAAVGLGALLSGLQAADGEQAFPLVFGALFLGAVAVPVVGGLLARRNLARAAALVERGRPAIGTIRSVRDTGVTINDDPRVELTVWIEPRDGGPPYEGVKTVTMSRVRPLRLGERFPVLVDAGDPSTFGLVTDITNLSQVPPAIRELWALAQRSTDRVGTLDGAAPANGTVVALVKLDELHRSGALTEAEYAAAKARVLGGPPLTITPPD